MRYIRNIDVNLEELKRDKEKNFQERLKFIDWWVEYMKKHSDGQWSSEQNKVINPQIKK